MATVVGLVSPAFGWTKPQGVNIGPVTIGGNAGNMWTVFVSVTFPTGTYAAADDAEFDPTEALESSQNGKTYTVLQAMGVTPGREDGDFVHFGPTGSITSNVVKAPLLQEDHSTEHADGAMGAWTDPITVALSVHAYPYDSA
jgi:hypothetical protein